MVGPPVGLFDWFSTLRPQSGPPGGPDRPFPAASGSAQACTRRRLLPTGSGSVPTMLRADVAPYSATFGWLRLASSMKTAMSVLTVGVVTLPVSFEGTLRRRNAESGIEKLRGQVDALIVIANDGLLQRVDKHASLKDSFHVADEVMLQAVQGLSDLVAKPGLVNLDVADLWTFFRDSGEVTMIVTTASGENRARTVAEQAASSHRKTLDGAESIVFNIMGGLDMSLFDVSEIADRVRAAAHPDCRVIFGAIVDEKMKDEIRVSLYATGL